MNGTVTQKGHSCPAHTHTRRHTLHPDLTRLVNHLSQGQGERTDSPLLCPSSISSSTSFSLSPKGSCPSPPILTLYITCFFTCLSVCFCLTVSPAFFYRLSEAFTSHLLGRDKAVSLSTIQHSNRLHLIASQTFRPR